jgi:malonyl-CoA O-methyltransferase
MICRSSQNYLLIHEHRTKMTQAFDEIAAAYDQWSSVYETNENATRDLARSVLRQQLNDLHGRDVLEIGCGTGLNTRYLAEHSRSVLGIDFSAGMLAQARRNISASNVRFEQADIRQGWSLPERAFDVVVCMLVLEHIEDVDHVFREAARLLRSGGEFFVCELHPYRQLQGGQAQFTQHETGEIIRVPAYLHDISDYVNAGVRSGFELLRMLEWRDGGEAAKKEVPRLVSIHLRLSA